MKGIYSGIKQKGILTFLLGKVGKAEEIGFFVYIMTSLHDV